MQNLLRNNMKTALNIRQYSMQNDATESAHKVT